MHLYCAKQIALIVESGGDKYEDAYGKIVELVKQWRKERRAGLESVIRIVAGFVEEADQGSNKGGGGSSMLASK
jgi:hypothetical protein